MGKNMQTNRQSELDIFSTALHNDISELIEKARKHVAKEYNITHVLLNWMIGKRIDKEFLNEKRAKYGEKIIDNIARGLTLKYGKGYGRLNLFRMLKFSRMFPDRKIVSTLSKQLSWSHFLLICAIDDELKRSFYTEMCRVQKWSVRAFKHQINSMLYERTAISKQPEEVIKSNLTALKENNHMSPELTFKDPYFINFVGGKNYNDEADLENLILDNIVDFLQELGDDFCFITRQKRMSTKKKDRYLDLLFFNRRLQRLIALEVKIGAFKPSHKGQMEWYLNWLDKNVRLPHEKKPLGILLCADKDQEDIEYLSMDNSGIHIAQYLSELPPKKILEQKLYNAIAIAREVYAKKLELTDEK